MRQNRWLKILAHGLTALLLFLTGCSTHRDASGHAQEHVGIKYLLKTDIDRVMDASRSQIISGLLRISDKLYRRNPKQWRKAGKASREAALENLKAYRLTPPRALSGRQEGAAALLAFNPDYGGDRVEALMYGLLTMVDAAYEHKEEFFITDSLNEQKFYNCARNMEIAIWKLSSTRDTEGHLLLLSNEINEDNQNLSFEREFGRIIGLLDFLADIQSDKNGRAVSRTAQSLAANFFFPIGALK